MSTSARDWRRPLLALAGLLVCACFAGLGYWQFGRGEYKAEWLQRVEAARAAPPRELDAALLDPDLLGLPVAVKGQLELRSAPRLLLDNQQREGRVGVREYALARALSASDRAPWLLLDLGWLPMPADRSLPALAPLPAELDALGLLTDLPGQGLRLGANPPPGEGTTLLAYVDADELAGALDIAIAPRLLRLDPALPIGHARDLDLLPNTLPPARHRGYALQWAALSLATLVITFLLYFRSRG